MEMMGLVRCGEADASVKVVSGVSLTGGMAEGTLTPCRAVYSRARHGSWTDPFHVTPEGAHVSFVDGDHFSAGLSVQSSAQTSDGQDKKKSFFDE